MDQHNLSKCEILIQTQTITELWLSFVYNVITAVEPDL